MWNKDESDLLTAQEGGTCHLLERCVAGLLRVRGGQDALDVEALCLEDLGAPLHGDVSLGQLAGVDEGPFHLAVGGGLLALVHAREGCVVGVHYHKVARGEALEVGEGGQ